MMRKRVNPVRNNAPLEFLTGFTHDLCHSSSGEVPSYHHIPTNVYFWRT